MKVVFFFFVIFVVGCSSNQSDLGDSISSEKLLNEIIERMETESINRARIDWDDFREQVFSVADSSDSDSSTYYGYERGTLLAIQKALELLNDDHSMYRTSYGMTISGSSHSCTAPFPVVPEIPDHIGYVNVESVKSTGFEATGYSTRLQKIIKEQDKKGITGWIIDLRGNAGGNMAPMLAGISSILGEVVTGYFIDPDGNEVMHEIKENAFWINGESIHALSNPMYELINESPKVAVLIDNNVSSSGEAVAISFKKRANTKFFGTSTCGLSTSNYGTPMPDGGMLILTVSTMADREKQLYGDSIQPDIHIENPSHVVHKAIEWLDSM